MEPDKRHILNLASVARLIWPAAFLLSAQITFAQQVPIKQSHFASADSMANVCKGQSVKRLYPLTMQLTAPFTSDADKFRAIFTWVCRNVKNDYAFSVESRKMRSKYAEDPEAMTKWNRDFSRRVFRKLVEDQSTVCTGYAWLTKAMADMAGIECIIVDGYARTVRANVGGQGMVNHSWNAVKLDGKWYLCDPTWSSGGIDVTNHLAVHTYDDAYFLADPSQFVRDHYPVDTAWLLLSEKPTLHEFLNRPLTYRGAYRQAIRALSPNTLEVEVARDIPVLFTVSREPSCNPVKVELVIKSSSRSGRTDQTITPELTETATGTVEFSHAFPFAGKYDVHIMIDAVYVASYSITVRKV